MKFGKEYASQMIPEWHEAYMNYDNLKTRLKQIQISKQENSTKATMVRPGPNPGRKLELALYRAFSGLTLRHPHQHVNANTTPDVENPAILVQRANRDGLETGYETRFLKVDEEGGEYELVFFRRLDDELNKVYKFYTSKVNEVMEEAERLEKQMHALIGFRIKVEMKSYDWNDSSVMTRFASDAPSSLWDPSSSHGGRVSTTTLSAPSPSWAASSIHGGRVSIDMPEESSRRQDQSDDDSSGDTDDEEIKPMNRQKISDDQDPNPSTRPASPLEILGRVKMNVTPEAPLSTMKVLLNVPKHTELKFNKQNLRRAEEQLKRAFIAYYHKLRLLKSYSFMNMLAFSKIMKKYDKVTSRNASKSYLEMVDSLFENSLNEVNILMERVEVTFIKHFSNSNRSKGMKILRPQPRKEKHRTTFSFGLCLGCSLALIVALVLIVRARHILDRQEEGSKYMNTMFPLYSLFGFIVLHMILYAGNVFFWRKYKVNHSFMLGFKHGTELGYRDIMYLSFALAALALAGVLSNLDMEMDPRTHDYKAFTELVPLILVVVIIGILICPFNIIYRSSRYFLIRTTFRCICAPLYAATLVDWIMADQLTSQVQAFRSFEFYICYYGWGDFKHRENTCKTNDTYKTFNFIVAAVPFWIRLLQCLRRMVQDNEPLWGYNAIKYFSTIVAVCTRTAYSLNDNMTWKIVAWISSAVAAIFCTYWDFVIDWGLLQRNSKNRWLRDKLVVPHKSVYFTAMVLNVVLRFAWLQTVLNFKVSSLHTEALTAIFASLEIIRRGIWNFFRLENEHLNNVGKFRASKSMPLPFNYDEDEDKDS